MLNLTILLTNCVFRLPGGDMEGLSGQLEAKEKEVRSPLPFTPSALEAQMSCALFVRLSG